MLPEDEESLSMPRTETNGAGTDGSLTSKSSKTEAFAAASDEDDDDSLSEWSEICELFAETCQKNFSSSTTVRFTTQNITNIFSKYYKMSFFFVHGRRNWD